jgi:hypothetical protein
MIGELMETLMILENFLLEDPRDSKDGTAG